MSRHSDIDRESFQTFLADAFAVQQSGLDAKSIAALIEIQQFMASGEFDQDRAMQVVADRALKVCAANGVAIALIEGNELVFRSGSGKAAQDVGRRVPAVLSVSPLREMREILRVENSKTDMRIEAHICRQFGAIALLMLPIWKNHVLAGVLLVLFDDAHSFQENEVRTYRLMVGALEHGLVQQRAARPAVARDPERICDSRVVLETAQAAESPAEGYGTLAETGEGAISQVQLSRSDPGSLAGSGAGLLANREEIRPRVSAFWGDLTGVLQAKASRLSSVDFWNAGAAVGAVIVLSVTAWIFHRTHTSNPRIEFAIPARHQTGEVTATKPLPANEEAKGSTLAEDRNETTDSTPRFRRVEVGPNEVDYVADDVTIRQFENRAARPRTRDGMGQVDFGDDVTVRYFPNTPVPASHAPSSSDRMPTLNQDTYRSR